MIFNETLQYYSLHQNNIAIICKRAKARVKASFILDHVSLFKYNPQ